MAYKEIEIETIALDRDIRELTGELDDAKKCISTMADDMRRLDSMWDGPANEAFMRQFALDEQYALELCGIVQKLIECMEYAKKQYDLCETEVGSLVKSI